MSSYQADRVFRPGAGFTLDLAGFILFTEAALEFHNRTQYPSSPVVWEEPALFTPYILAEGGVRRNMAVGDATLFFVAEYLFAGSGFTSREEDLFFQAMGMGSAPVPEYLGQHYLFFSMALALENRSAGRPPVLVDEEKETLRERIRELEKKLDMAENYKKILAVYEEFRDKGSKKNRRIGKRR